MLTIRDCFNTCSLEQSALSLVSKVTYQPKKAFTSSVDEQDFWQFGRNIVKKVKSIQDQLSRHTYRFGPCKKITRKAKLNKVRDIYISNWSDKLVERWLNECLTIMLHKWFSRHSYAFRVEGVGLDSCIINVTRAAAKSDYFIKRDISQFFYSIDHDLMFEKLHTVVDESDYLFDLLSQRIRCEYVEHGEHKIASVGVPFGSSLAPVLANISLTDLDKEMNQFRVWYFRYSDDFLIAGTDAGETYKAGQHLDNSLREMKFDLKQSHYQNLSFVESKGFDRVRTVKHLGLEFHVDGTVKMAVEKQRKLINFYKNAFKRNKRKFKKGNLDQRLELAVGIANDVIKTRIRSAAIVDYYLKHVNDEVQLRNMDRIVMELLIGAVLNKKFRKRDFGTISPGKLRELGLMSLLHRNRLHRHGHLRVNFLSMYSNKVATRHEERMWKRKERIDHMRMSKKIKRQSRVSNGQVQQQAKAAQQQARAGSGKEA